MLIDNGNLERNGAVGLSALQQILDVYVGIRE